MKWPDIGTMLSLAAVWGASYLFMRMGAGEFGALPLAGMRAIGAMLILVPVLGLTNSALPFVLCSWAALLIPAGSSALFTGATGIGIPRRSGHGRKGRRLRHHTHWNRAFGGRAGQVFKANFAWEYRLNYK